MDDTNECFICMIVWMTLVAHVWMMCVCETMTKTSLFSALSVFIIEIQIQIQIWKNIFLIWKSLTEAGN
jgi:hypothetical protein